MRRSGSVAALALLAGLNLGSTAALAETVQARLDGYQEVPTLSSPGSGHFKARIDKDAGAIYYELEYAGLMGTVVMSHIHFGQRATNGGIIVWLCQSTTNPAPVAVAGSVPTCPATGGNVNGMLMQNSVIGPTGQFIAAGEFEELIAAIRAGAAYVNVHTTVVPAGEIRGQIGGGNGRGGGHHH